MAPPSERREWRDRVERVDEEELDGVDTERSNEGIASSANDGDALSEGELGRCSGEAMVLSGGVFAVSAMVDM